METHTGMLVLGRKRLNLTAMTIFAPPKRDRLMNPMVKILAGSASNYLGESIAKEFGVQLGNVIIQHFSDGEFQPSIEETVRGMDVIIIQSTFPPSDN
ncbi:MAG: ribose-phosphate pyrophosphokinase-like domain-containing protein, partial [Flavobacteriales bacterium]